MVGKHSDLVLKEVYSKKESKEQLQGTIGSAIITGWNVEIQAVIRSQGSFAEEVVISTSIDKNA